MPVNITLQSSSRNGTGRPVSATHSAFREETKINQDLFIGRQDHIAIPIGSIAIPQHNSIGQRRLSDRHDQQAIRINTGRSRRSSAR